MVNILQKGFNHVGLRKYFLNAFVWYVRVSFANLYRPPLLKRAARRSSDLLFLYTNYTIFFKIKARKVNCELFDLFVFFYKKYFIDSCFLLSSSTAQLNIYLLILTLFFCKNIATFCIISSESALVVTLSINAIP